MKKLHIIAIATLAVLSITGAQAQSSNKGNGYFGEIGYSQVKVSGDGGSAKPDAVRLLIGNEINKNLDIEAMYTSTVSKENRVGYQASVNTFGILLKPKLALTENTDVFARVGAVRADITASTNGSHTATDLAYGIGIQTNFSKSVYGQIDYLNQYDRGGISAKGYTVSLGTRF